MILSILCRAVCDLFAKESFSNATLKPTSVAAILAPGATSANAATATVVVGGLAPYAKFNESMLLDGEAMQRDENCSWGARAAASGASLFVASPHDSVVGAPNADAAGALFARALGALELHATLVRVDESPTRMLPRFVLVVSDASHCTCVVQLWFDNLNRKNEKRVFLFFFFFFAPFFPPFSLFFLDSGTLSHALSCLVLNFVSSAKSWRPASSSLTSASTCLCAPRRRRKPPSRLPSPRQRPLDSSQWRRSRRRRA
jgi:hypothetical protein